MVFNAREHDGLVLRIGYKANGVHAVVGKMFPDLVFEKGKVVLFFELVGEAGGPVEVGLLGGRN
jgi:hypothetical protein